MKANLLKKRMVERVLMIVVLFGFATTPVDAQGIKGLLKKANKVLDNITETKDAVMGKGAIVKLENGGTMQNALSGKVDMELIGVYGRSTSENYGDVYLVLKMRMNENMTSISIGGNSSLPPTLVDQDGNAYNMSLGWYNQTLTEGIFQKVSMAEKWSFKGVKKTATVVQLLRIGVSLDNNNRGFLTIKNVPIQWDVEPEDGK